jgi:hypothetical protein
MADDIHLWRQQQTATSGPEAPPPFYLADFSPILGIMLLLFCLSLVLAAVALMTSSCRRQQQQQNQLSLWRSAADKVVVFLGASRPKAKRIKRP